VAYKKKPSQCHIGGFGELNGGGVYSRILFYFFAMVQIKSKILQG